MKPISMFTVVDVLILSTTLALAVDAKAQNVLASTASYIAVDTPTANWQILDKPKGNRIRIDPIVDWNSYKRYEFAPSSYKPCEAHKQIRPRDAQKMTALLDASIRSAYMKQPVIDGPILEIRPVIINIKRTNTAINLISFAAIQIPASYGAASVRYELIDEQTGRQIGDITSTRNARPWNVYPWNVLRNFQATGQSSVLLKSSAKRLKKDTDLLARIPTAAKAAVDSNQASAEAR